MARCGRCGCMTDFVILLNRVALGGYFALAGYGKIFGEGGVKAFYEGPFKQMLPGFMAGEGWQGFVKFFGRSLPYAELTVGILVLVGLLGRLSAFVKFSLLVSFLIALVSKFGYRALPYEEVKQMVDGAEQVVKNYTLPGAFHYDYILAPLALLLVYTGMGRFSFDRLIFGDRCGNRQESDGRPKPPPQPQITNFVTPPPPSARIQQDQNTEDDGDDEG